MFSFSSSGSFKNTEAFLKEVQKQNFMALLDHYGKDGIIALSMNTPRDTGETSLAWGYSVIMDKGEARLQFTNANVNKGVPIAIILQYGHGTGTGGYVEGRDYINPAIQPVFDRIVDSIWMEVKSL